MYRMTALILLLSLPLVAQSNRDDMTPMQVAYELTILDDTQTMQISMTVHHAKRSATRVAMPNWKPGSYSIRHFGNWVSDVRATALKDGSVLPCERIDPLTWSVDTSTCHDFRLQYTIAPRSRRFAGMKPDPKRIMTGMHFEGPATFMYVKGEERSGPVTCRYRLPGSWKVANGMAWDDDPFFRRARDYDTFIDSPTIVGLFDRVDFDIEGTPFSCVFWNPQGPNSWDMEKFTHEVVKPICREQGRIFGSFPFPRYVFLFTVSPFGGGGLEHLNSTSIGLSGVAMKRNVLSGGSIVAHEFFHTWNVKRIRPITLGPFEYEHENYTGNLWVSEGWTSYYGDLTLARVGLKPQEQYLKSIASGISRELQKPRRREHSVYWASRDIWHRGRVNEKGRRVDYYTFGELLGLIIDLKIRDVTDNRKSLDDVMRFLNRWFAERNVGFEEDDIERACTAISNYDFSDFFARYVRGTVDPPFAEYFALAGLELSVTQLKADFPFYTGPHKDGLVVRIARSAGRRLKLKKGDIIKSIDGVKVTDPIAYLKSATPGQVVQMIVAAPEGDRKIQVELASRERTLTDLRPMPNPSAKQKRIYTSWMSAH